MSYTNHDNQLPRNYEVVGLMAVPDLPPANPWTPRWTVGQQLASQRHWDRGERGSDPRRVHCPASELLALPLSPDVWELKVLDIDSLDCSEVTRRFPNLAELSLEGRLGDLGNADALNALTSLKLLSIGDLFGMESSDVYRYEATTRLDALYLNNIPEQYAAATKRLWKNQAACGTTLEVLGARKPQWVAENRNNPFRDWDMRRHISRPRYAKVLALYKSTRAEVLGVLSQGVDKSALGQIGRQYGEALNVLDGTRSPFIETEEREDLFAALDQVLTEAGLTQANGKAAREALFDGVEQVRSW